MAGASKDKYTDKQKRQAEHITDGYVKQGVSRKTAKSRGWATVNKESGGGKRSGGGREEKVSHRGSQRGISTRGTSSKRTRSNSSSPAQARQ